MIDVTYTPDGSTTINVGNIPAIVIVLELEARPRLFGNVNTAARVAASLNDEWRELLLHALEEN
jgi:hypothetical protein